ncbi:MAG TPA: LysE family translocator [Chitinophagaceae bacterium]|nr:LysE family translocator [Chitinophagaceae bacterium]
MLTSPHFYLFLTASLLINLAPGPDMLYTAARSLSQGARAGILSAAGIFSGCLFHVAAAVFGLSRIMERSVLLFHLVQYAGAAYLLYLGIRSLVRKTGPASLVRLQTLPYRTIYMQAVLTNLLNPKVAIFFLSFLPQFIDPAAGPASRQFALLGLWFDLQGTAVLILVALLTGRFRQVLQGSPAFWRWQEKGTGLILVALGLRMLGERK